jgi:hypothetical protein
VACTLASWLPYFSALWQLWGMQSSWFTELPMCEMSLVEEHNC